MRKAGREGRELAGGVGEARKGAGMCEGAEWRGVVCAECSGTWWGSVPYSDTCAKTLARGGTAWCERVRGRAGGAWAGAQ